MNFTLTVLFWLFLNIMIGLTMEFALFTQTTSGMKEAGILQKILTLFGMFASKFVLFG